MAKRKEPSQEFKTEEQIKAEAKARIEEQRRLESMKKPRSQTEKKVENFFYHYKYVLLAAVAGLFVASFFIHDLVTKEDPDLSLIAVTSRFLGDEAQQELTDVLTPLVPDLNGDGKQIVHVNYINLTVDADSIGVEEEPPAEDAEDAEVQDISINPGAEMEYANVMKLMAVMATGDDPILLMDENAYKYLTRGDPESQEEPEPIFRILEGEVAGAEGERLPVEQTVAAEIAGLEELSFYLRDWQAGGKREALYAQALELIRSFSKKQ